MLYCHGSGCSLEILCSFSEPLLQRVCGCSLAPFRGSMIDVGNAVAEVGGRRIAPSMCRAQLGCSTLPKHKIKLVIGRPPSSIMSGGRTWWIANLVSHFWTKKCIGVQQGSFLLPPTNCPSIPQEKQIQCNHLELSAVVKQAVFFFLRLGFKSLGRNSWNQKIVPLDCKVHLICQNREIPLLKEAKISDFCWTRNCVRLMNWERQLLTDVFLADWCSKVCQFAFFGRRL